MARTPAGALLTAQHRAAQTQLRAAALRDYTTVWPLWNGDAASFRRLVDATLPLVRAHHRLSATVAAAYYGAVRAAERPGGSPTPRLAGMPGDDEIAGTLYLTGLEMTRRAITAGLSPQAARQTALVRTSGTVTRLALTGGRATLVESVRDDARAGGYQRVLAGGSCDFCLRLAGTVTNDDFEAHDHCGCVAEPHFI